MEKEANIGIDIELGDLLNSIFERFVYNNDLTEATGYICHGRVQVTCDYAYNNFFLFPFKAHSLSSAYNFVDYVVRERLEKKGIEIKLHLNPKQRVIACNLYKHE